MNSENMPMLPRLELNPSWTVYKLSYSDGGIVLRTFSNKKEAEWFIHNEGDHLREAFKVQ